MSCYQVLSHVIHNPGEYGKDGVVLNSSILSARQMEAMQILCKEDSTPFLVKAIPVTRGIATAEAQ
eukprot:m.157655 g.157655  ORF g.157655 m.157655 type:complete len:66 (-) comp15167_c0_seq3:23-220(-)